MTYLQILKSYVNLSLINTETSELNQVLYVLVQEFTSRKRKYSDLQCFERMNRVTSTLYGKYWSNLVVVERNLLRTGDKDIWGIHQVFFFCHSLLNTEFVDFQIENLNFSCLSTRRLFDGYLYVLDYSSLYRFQHVRTVSSTPPLTLESHEEDYFNMNWGTVKCISLIFSYFTVENEPLDCNK